MRITIRSLMLMWMVTEVLRGLVCFMHAIGTRHGPVQLGCENDDEHEDKLFRHGADYKLYSDGEMDTIS